MEVNVKSLFNFCVVELVKSDRLRLLEKYLATSVKHLYSRIYDVASAEMCLPCSFCTHDEGCYALYVVHEGKTISITCLSCVLRFG
jgi:TPP-dependent indolepyruvate ferredoxin oxidoreductase alpha subunit